MLKAMFEKPTQKLSDRERQILLLAAEDKTDKQIAEALGITESSIHTYWGRIRNKCGASSRGALIARCLGDELRAETETADYSSELLRALGANLTDFAIFSVGHDRRIGSWSPAVERVLGYQEHEFVGQDFSLVFTPEDREAGAPEEEMETALREGSARDRRWHMRRDGARIFIDGELAALHDRRGDIRGFVKIMRDMSRTHWLEHEVERLREQMTPDEDDQPHIEELIRSHFELRSQGNVEHDLPRHFDTNVILAGPFGVRRGYDGVRELATTLERDLPQARFEIQDLHDEGDMGLVRWTASSEQRLVAEGVDTYKFRHGLIAVLSVSYKREKS
jgi:PAS domain S-box-containing protein